MTDTSTPSAAPAADQTPPAQPSAEWKPEPRQWTWKDVFTAPMLAFKPKCMLIMAVCAILIGLWYRIAPGDQAFGEKTPAFVDTSLLYLWHIVALIVFSLGATLVATFMKADLLDDEFLTFGEALGQYKKRLVPAILVPLFLTGLYAGFKLILALCETIGSIPFAGPTLYALLYPLGFLLGLFIVLLSIALGLSIFVFPAIIAIRKHGWFDNVVDTFEAVGTKPHVLVGSGVIVGLLIVVSQWICFGAMGQLKDMTQVMPGTHLAQNERRADQVQDSAIAQVAPVFAVLRTFGVPAKLIPAVDQTTPSWSFSSEVGWKEKEVEISGYNKVTGTVVGVWKSIFTAFILGYLLNLFIGGGMLTYLVVREDDYWDDEDLEDLDQLAKELEDEAKQEAAKAAATPAEAKSPGAGPSGAPKPEGDKPAT